MISVSLCIPVYGSAEYLPSLFGCLRTLEPKPAEILVLDDASLDTSASLMRRFAEQASPGLDVRLLRNTTNSGVAASYNRLAREARGEWVHILDADDYPVEADFYALVGTEFAPHLDLIVTAQDSNSNLLHRGASAFTWMVPQQPPPWWPLLGSFATRSGVVYRRARLLEQPFPDPAFPGSDVLHLLRLRKDRNCLFLGHAHVFYRVHAAALSSHARDYREYRAGLAELGWVTWLAHTFDLGLRAAGQRIDRRKP